MLGVLLLKLITFIAISLYCFIFSSLEVSVLSDELQLMLLISLSSVVLKQSNKCVTEVC